ncbi:hypothetical protein [Actinopolyspora halophila]|uniref:hypothetical protein n=1 Tax=Actinopolyspora halophila TaxID=1850 RepID=UPI00035D11FF|nr:hypothetical protein [Actinopolyspora halophila]
MTVPLDDFGPFDTGIGADTTEAAWRAFTHHVRHSGVIATRQVPPETPNELEVHADGSGMQVKLRPGEAWLNGHWGELTTDTVLPLATADPTNPRIDLVVIRADYLANEVVADVKTGSPAATPAAPTVQRDVAMFEIAVAEVRVEAGAASIAAGKVTDRRLRVGAGQFSHYDPPLKYEGEFGTHDVDTDGDVDLGAGGTKFCRWFLQGKTLHIRYDFRWDVDDRPYTVGDGRVYTYLPGGLVCARISRMSCHLWVHDDSLSPVDYDFAGTALIYDDTSYLLPFFQNSQTDSRIGWYRLESYPNGGAGTGVPDIAGGYPDGGSLVIQGHVEVQ